MNNDTFKQKLWEIHDHAKRAGLDVRFWNANKDTLVLAVPGDGKKEAQQKDSGAGGSAGGSAEASHVCAGQEGWQSEGDQQGENHGASEEGGSSQVG